MLWSVECADRETGKSYALVLEAPDATSATRAATEAGHLAGRAQPVYDAPRPEPARSQESRELLLAIDRLDRRLARSSIFTHPCWTICGGIWLTVLTGAAVWFSAIMLFGGLLAGLAAFVARRGP